MSTETVQTEGTGLKLNWRRTFLIGLGFFGIEALWRVYNNFVPLFLQSGSATFDAAQQNPMSGFGLNTFTTGLVMGLDNLAALFILPLVGVISDRTFTRIGRRMPFILFFAPIAAIAFVLIPLAPMMISPDTNGDVSAMAALAWLRGHPVVDPDRVSLLGLSMGGAVASVVAGEDERIVALVLWSALSDPTDVVRRSAEEGSGSMPAPLGLQPGGGFDIGGHLLGLEFLTTIEQARPLDSLKEFRRLVLILHGSADEVIPPFHADRFLETIGKQHATRHWIQDADHTYNAHVWEKEVFQLTADWLRSAVG